MPQDALPPWWVGPVAHPCALLLPAGLQRRGDGVGHGWRSSSSIRAFCRAARISSGGTSRPSAASAVTTPSMASFSSALTALGDAAAVDHDEDVGARRLDFEVKLALALG
jgi:hypothetical protein